MKILGVTFTSNVYDICDFNSVEIVNKVKVIRLQRSGIDTIKYHT